MPSLRVCRSLSVAAVVGLAALAISGPAKAVLEFDQNVTNNAIFGSGNDNGFYTVERNADVGVEVGLRAKLRFDSTNTPQNIFNSNGDGTYTFDAGQAPTGFSFNPPGLPTTPIWNFEWSVNTDFNGMGANLDQFTYQLDIDFDPASPGTNFLSFDPIITPYADHSIGDNSTAQGAGAEAPTGDTAQYASLLMDNNLAQNSWNMEFFNDAPFDIFDPNTPGEYTFIFTVFQSSSQVAQTTINVLVTAVPEPGTLLLFSLGLIGIGLLGRRRLARA